MLTPTGQTHTGLTLTGARAIVVDTTTESAGDLHLVDGRVSDRPAPDADRLDVSGCVLTPGLVNAHHHLLQTAFRTRPGTRHVRFLKLPMWTWQDLGERLSTYEGMKPVHLEVPGE